ncbi:MAG TPA: hypothetical protein ENO23_06350, partial [Alphaproteobacteria bacterium]|nr:hypothetical protein [Alphaproteobacteria bacterium]
MSPRSLALAVLALAALAAPGAAQELVEPPSVLLRGVPFELTVVGDPNVPTSSYEIRTGDGRILSSGSVEAN